MGQYIRGTVPVGRHAVVDPNTLNLEPDPEFWHNLEFGYGSRVILSILKKIIKSTFREKLFSSIRK